MRLHAASPLSRAVGMGNGRGLRRLRWGAKDAAEERAGWEGPPEPQGPSTSWLTSANMLLRCLYRKLKS